MAGTPSRSASSYMAHLSKQRATVEKSGFAQVESGSRRSATSMIRRSCDSPTVNT
jgi:hypothetical protein